MEYSQQKVFLRCLTRVAVQLPFASVAVDRWPPVSLTGPITATVLPLLLQATGTMGQLVVAAAWLLNPALGAEYRRALMTTSLFVFIAFVCPFAYTARVCKAFE